MAAESRRELQRQPQIYAGQRRYGNCNSFDRRGRRGSQKTATAGAFGKAFAVAVLCAPLRPLRFKLLLLQLLLKYPGPSAKIRGRLLQLLRPSAAICGSYLRHSVLESNFTSGREQHEIAILVRTCLSPIDENPPSRQIVRVPHEDPRGGHA